MDDDKKNGKVQEQRPRIALLRRKLEFMRQQREDAVRFNEELLEELRESSSRDHLFEEEVMGFCPEAHGEAMDALWNLAEVFAEHRGWSERHPVRGRARRKLLDLWYRWEFMNGRVDRFFNTLVNAKFWGSDQTWDTSCSEDELD